jgi:hypothetical protein
MFIRHSSSRARLRVLVASVLLREIIADRLKKSGWSLGWVSVVDSHGQTIWIVDAHLDDGKREGSA